MPLFPLSLEKRKKKWLDEANFCTTSYVYNSSLYLSRAEMAESTKDSLVPCLVELKINEINEIN